MMKNICSKDQFNALFRLREVVNTYAKELNDVQVIDLVFMYVMRSF